MNCAICESRRARRYCPALTREICTACCGSSRETTIDCPLACEHLQAAHIHERIPAPDPAKFPHPDVEISERFSKDNAAILSFLSSALLNAALSTQGATDNDVREALDAMARTYRTLESGLIYETKPTNLIAAAIAQQLSAEIDRLRRSLRERAGMEMIRDADIFGVLVMLQRLEFLHNNGRPRGRAFLGFLQRELRAPGAAESPVVPA